MGTHASGVLHAGGMRTQTPQLSNTSGFDIVTRHRIEFPEVNHVARVIDAVSS